jgi:hypothetical protein
MTATYTLFLATLLLPPVMWALGKAVNAAARRWG